MCGIIREIANKFQTKVIGLQAATVSLFLKKSA
jgi:hypothetical protein